jgi:tight adherence protein C
MMEHAGLGIVLGGATLVLLVLGIKTNQADGQVRERIGTLSNAREKKALVSRSRQLEDSFQQRLIFPLAQLVFEKMQSFIPLSNRSWVKSKLIQAGYQKSHYPRIFLGIQLLCAAAGFSLLFVFTVLFGKVSGSMGLIISLAFGGMGYGLPLLWLVQHAQKRQENIQKSLADFLDLLVICVEAGLSLDVAIQKITSIQSVRTSSYLKEELLHYTKDVGLGRARRDALLDMAERAGVDDFNTLINAVIQSMEMGSSIAHTLRVQSDALRVKRLSKAEEKANKIPVKMVLPIYIFLFPAIFVCIFGPIGMVMVEAIGKISNNVQLGS